MAGLSYERMEICSRIKTEIKEEPIGDYSFSYQINGSQVSEENQSLDQEYPELQEEFFAVMERIKYETVPDQIEIVDGNSTASIFSEKYQVPRSTENPTSLTSLCRLCASQSNAMVYIFEPDKMHRENILKQIEHCLPITVSETDTLSKQACESCLEKLDLCHRFRNAVAEAEVLQILMYNEQASHELQEKELLPNLEDHSERSCLEERTNEEGGRKNSINDHQSVDLASKIEKTFFRSAENSTRNEYTLNIEDQLKLDKKMCDTECHSPMIAGGDENASTEKNGSRKSRNNDDTVSHEEVLSDPGSSGKHLDHEIIKCQICEETFENWEKCNEHTNIHLSKNDYPCGLCAKTLASKKDWEEHNLHHAESRDNMRPRRKSVVQISEEVQSQEVKLQLNGAKTRSSGKYDKIMDSKRFLQQHVLTIHRRRKDSPKVLCWKQFRSPEKPKGGLRKKARSIFECNSCKSKFRSNDLLQVHKKICCGTLSRIKNWPCGYCGINFSKEKELTVHLRSHEGDRTYICDICYKTFATKAAKMSHYRVHAIKKPSFACDICDKTFVSAVSVRHHSIVHADIRPYKCPICPQTFKSAGTRGTHLSVHKNEAPYQCDVCGASFKRKYNLVKHEEKLSCDAKPMKKKSKLFTKNK